VLSEETSGGRLKFKTIKSEETKSILLIYDADLLHSGKYSCYPSNTEIASIRVHVLQGEFRFHCFFRPLSGSLFKALIGCLSLIM